MGIDVYMKWKQQSDAQRKAQFTGFSITAGEVGYLREAYHGGPYAIAYLITEDWDKQPKGGFKIPATKLRERLPSTVLAALYRQHVVYGERLDDPSVLNLKEGDDQPVRALMDGVKRLLAEAKTAKNRDFAPNEEQARAVSELIERRALPDYALSFVDFVSLAERKEKETGEAVRVYVSA